MSDLFSPDFLFRNAVLGGWIVCLLCSVLGVYVALRRMVLLGVALPQAGAAGIALVFLATHHVHGEGGSAHWVALGGSLGATFAALALLVVGSRGSRTPVEWRIGAVFAVATAATLLTVALNPTGDLEMTSLLRGELLAISNRDLVLLAVAAALVLSVFALFRREILLVSFDAEFARTIGRNPAAYDFLLYLLLGVGISVGVMTAGPMVVFGFLVLPPLAALRLTTHLTATFAVAAVIATACSLGGFALSYHADLPAGPVYVLLAAGVWLLAAVTARTRQRVALAAGVLALALTPLALSGCGLLKTPDERVAEPAPRGNLPAFDGAGAVAVLPFRNETGQPLRLASGNPLDEFSRALGRGSSDPSLTVLDLLQVRAAQELARRGYDVVPLGAVSAAVKQTPSDSRAALEQARAAGLAGPVLIGTLKQFSRNADDLLHVRLELTLVDPASGAIAWQGSARRPVPVPGAFTLAEIAQDASPAIFAEAFSR
jgi:ABC-type Mn2+/Zn2+ transport system permease subunit